jgi:hypothetical protein
MNDFTASKVPQGRDFLAQCCFSEQLRTCPIPSPQAEKVAAGGNKHFQFPNPDRHLMTEKVYILPLIIVIGSLRSKRETPNNYI